MSILHELRSLAGGGQNTLPSWRTIALLCMNPTVKSSALQQQFTSFTMSVKAKSHHAIQLASWSARPASELDSVMEFGLTRVQVISFHRGESENHWKFHHAIQLANQLAS